MSTSGGIEDSLNDFFHVSLDRTDIRRAYNIAEERMSTMNKSDKKGQVTYESEDSGESVTTSDAYERGAFGEVAAEYVWEVEVDEEVSPIGDDGEDFVIDGFVSDLKTRTFNNPDLLVSEKKIQRGVYENTDAFILAYKYDDENIYFIGYAWFEEIMDQEPERHPDTMVNRYMNWKDIHHFNSRRCVLTDGTSDVDQDASLNEFLD